MHLLPDSLMFGVSPALLIDCARQIHESHYSNEERLLSLDDFSRALGAPVGESALVLQGMVAEGFFERRDGQRVVPTKKLGQLALATISVGISRADAAVLLSQIVEKAAWVNGRAAEFGHGVICIVVFGSWLSSKPRLGDLDIGVAIEEFRTTLEHGENEDIHVWMERVSAARRRTLNALRLRQPRRISVHTLDEVVRLATPYEVIFGALPKI